MADPSTASFSMEAYERYRRLSAEKRNILVSRLEKVGAGSVLPASAALAHSGSPDGAGIGFSLFFFAGKAAQFDPIYQRFLEFAELADTLGLEAVWVPERHFHEFGSPYPNPSLLAAAVASRTKNIGIRAGSVVLPLHNSIRVVEDWSVVDQLSNGRCGVAFASGWHPADFQLLSSFPYQSRREKTFQAIDSVDRMWRSRIPEACGSPGLGGEEGALRLHPRPVQPILPIWLTSTSNRDTWMQAALRGCGVLTGLLEQNTKELGQNIEAYNETITKHYSRHTGKVTTMLHCMLHECAEKASQSARAALGDYFSNHMKMYMPLVRKIAPDIDVDALSTQDRQALVSLGIERYFNGSALVGSASSVQPLCAQFADMGVSEIACLIDFGVSDEDIVATIEQLGKLVKHFRSPELSAQTEPH